MTRWMQKTLIAGLGFILLSMSINTTFAAPTLKSRILVRTDIVTLADLFEGVEALPNRAIFRAPKPGTSGQVQINQLRAALDHAGIDIEFATDLSSIDVARAGQLVTEKLATDLLKQALVQRGLIDEQSNWQFSLPPMPAQLIADGSAEPFVDASTVSLVPSTGRVVGRLIVPGQGAITLSGNAIEMVEAVQLKNGIQKGDILTLNDVELIEVPKQRVAHFETPDIADIVGKTLKSNRNSGSLLSQDDIVAAQIIKRGNLVTLTLNHGALSLTARVQALENGAVSDLIRVLNLRSNRTLYAKVEPDGTLSVPSPHATQTLAGL